MADLRHLLAIYVHAHQTGNSVPPHIDAEARAALAAEPPAPAEPVATLHVSDFRGYENYDFQHLVDLPLGHYKLFTACTAQPPAPAPAADGEREELASALEVTGSYEIPSYEQLRRAAALLREARPQPVPGWQPIDTAPQGLTDAQLDALERQHWKVESNIEYEPGAGFAEALDRHETFQHRAYARAAIAAHEAARPRLTPEEVKARFRAWWGECYPNVPAGRHTVRSHVAFALHLLGGEVAA